MAKGVNKVILIGSCGRDAEIRYMPSGSAVVNVSLATSEQWKDKQTGEKQERTEWHNVSFFGRLAEIAGEYVRKGMPLYIEGSLRTRKWQDKDGNDRYTTEVVASDMQMLGSRQSAREAVQRDNDQYGIGEPPSGVDDGFGGGSLASNSADPFSDDIPFLPVEF